MPGTTQLERISLDDEQRAVVDFGTGACAVLGGPGTGKTSALVERFVRLSTSEGCSPDRILFLVPNRAQKMALQDLLTRRLLFGEGLEALIEVPVYTWHGLANHLVSRHYDLLGYTEPPVLLTSPEQWGTIRDALAGEQEANWPHHKGLLNNKGFVDEVVDFVIRVGQRAMETADLEALLEQRPRWESLVRFYRSHREQLRARSRVDYPTLLRDAVELIANLDDVRDGLHRRFLHVLVDDGQELAFVQQRLLRFLTPYTDGGGGPAGSDDGRSLVIAADPDSSIETFRGADPLWLQRFGEEFGDHRTIVLPTSYRLGPALAERTRSFIELNGPASHRPSAFAGDTMLDVHRYQSLAAEMEAIGRELRLSHLKDGVAYADMAILLTSPRSMLPALERALQAVEVPYSISAPDRPLEREPAVRTFCELARLAFDQEDDPDRLAELLRSPLFGLDTKEVRELERAALAEGLTLPQHVERMRTSDACDGRVRHLLVLRDLLRDNQDRTADETFWEIWTHARHYRDLEGRSRKSLADAANRDLDALVAFARALGRFVERRRGKGTLKDYLDAIGRADFGSDVWLPPERTRGGVQILSFHAAKGREWDIVAVCGCVEGAIPKGRRAQGLFDPYFLDEDSPIERARQNEAEDRRVFYVALTRARKRCIVTTSPGPTRKGRPSRFIAELAGELPDVQKPEGRAPLTFSELAARQRAILANSGASKTERLAALATIARICELDPSCAAAQPSEWWWRWDWTEGPIPINEQRPRTEEEDLPADKLRTSYSRISEYDNCGLRYLCGVVLGLDPDTSHNMAFGSWIHTIFEEIELGKVRGWDALWARYEELFDESVFPNKPIARQFRHDGKVMLERYIRFLKPGESLLAEQSFTIDFNGHRIRGRIDRVDKVGKNVVVKDYKTSRNPVGFEEARESLQLAIYYLAARQVPDIAEQGEPCGMQLVYPASMSKGDVTVRAQKPEEAEVVLEKLPALIEGVLAEDFSPNPEADCRWCKFKPLCPLWAEGKELPA